MKVLWLINTLLPETAEFFNEEIEPYGGWLISSSFILSNTDNIELSIVFPKTDVRDVVNFKGEKINYFAIPPIDKKYYDVKNHKYLNSVIDIVKPNIVHVYGHDYFSTLAMVDICNRRRIALVISIQGFISFIARHYMAFIPDKKQKRYTFRDFIRQDNMKQQQKKLITRGKYEREAILKAKHVIGRTTWDKACVTQTNPNIQYHFCNETLREEFYKHTWSLGNCEKRSIFLSQGYYPLKGLHLLLEAMPMVLDLYPDAVLYVSGINLLKKDTLRDRLRVSSYAKYIKELIDRYGLKDKVIFTGPLDEKQMCERYLKSNVYVNPSSIENSPNSLGEAMILGLPCVAANVGGIPDMLVHNQEGFLYQSDAPYMLAYYICQIFRDSELANKFSHNARNHAMVTHNKELNNNSLIEIYNNIICSYS